MKATADSLRDRYYTPHEFAQIVGVVTDTVLAWVRDERLPAIKLGKVILIPRDALERLLDRQEGDRS